MLDGVQHHRLLRRLGELYDSLDAQQVGPVQRPNQIGERLERRRRNRLLGCQRERANMIVVPVHIVSMGVLGRIGMRIGLVREPALHIRALAVRVIEATIEEPRGR